MHHNSMDLLQGVPCRHTFSRIDKEGLERQLMQLHDIHMYNIFILGSVETINMVLKEAESNDSRKNMFSKKWAWFLITKASSRACTCMQN